MKKNNFTQKIFLLIMVGIISSTNFFALANTVVVSPEGGQSKSSNYILDYDTVVNQKSSPTTNTVFIVQNVKKDECESGDCNSDVATIREIDVVNSVVATNAEEKVSGNISVRNLTYLSIGSLLILVMIILIVRFFSIVEDKNKYE